METLHLNPTNPRPIIGDEIFGLRAVDAANAELRARNEERVKAMKQAMGRKYLLHPDNAPKKINYRSILDEKVGQDVQTA